MYPLDTVKYSTAIIVSLHFSELFSSEPVNGPYRASGDPDSHALVCVCVCVCVCACAHACVMCACV